MSDAVVLRQWRSAAGADSPWWIVFDATLSEDITLESKVTEDPVASGSPISDHMYDLPDKLSLTCEVSDVPPSAVYKALGGRSLDQAFADGAGTTDPLTGDPLDFNKARSVLALERLDQLRLAHEPFYVQTGLRLFANMVCTKIHFVTNLQNGQVLSFTADLQAVRIVYTQTVRYPPTMVPKKGSRPTDNGKVDTPPITGLGPLPEAKKKSLLKMMLKTGTFDPSALDPTLVGNRQGPLVPGAEG